MGNKNKPRDPKRRLGPNGEDQGEYSSRLLAVAYDPCPNHVDGDFRVVTLRDADDAMSAEIEAQEMTAMKLVGECQDLLREKTDACEALSAELAILKRESAESKDREIASERFADDWKTAALRNRKTAENLASRRRLDFIQGFGFGFLAAVVLSAIVGDAMGWWN